MIHFPCLSDDEVGNLRWMAESYSNELSVYILDNDRLLRDNRVRITPGYSTGIEAEGVIQPSGGHKDVMARIPGCMRAPLLRVGPGEYKLIELDTKSKHAYTHLDNDCLRENLHDALGRYHTSGNVAEEGTRLACKVLRSYDLFRVETDMMHCKIYSLLLSAYKLLGDEEEFTRLHDMMRDVLPVAETLQSRALLLVTLYGCADSAPYRQVVHEMVDPWRSKPSPEKSKLSLIHRLDDCDRWLRHEIS